ncbi:MAG: DUF1206 domain-containing protein [Acidimicrobiales bacterium]
MARAGLGARAIVYAVLGVLAYLIVARGESPSQASGEGALAEIAKQPFGPVLLGLLSAGLIAYCVWRAVQAITGIEPAARDTASVAKRVGWSVIAVVYFALFTQALSILAGSGSSGGPSSHPQPYAAAVLGWPGGAELLGLLGAGIAIGGMALAVWGCVNDYGEKMEQGRMGHGQSVALRATGIFGNVTRGLLAVLIGVYLLVGAVDGSPSKVKNLDQALQSVAHSPGGPWWLAIAATGLVAFAVFSGFEAVYRRI